jgi:rRNA maturation RNase YbeY
MARLLINFFNEDVAYTLKQKIVVRHWINTTIIQEGYQLKELNFIFCSDTYLLNINQQYLRHNTFTDIVTFDNSDEPKKILGDVFISTDRIKENAQTFNVTEADETHRVIIHGTLHLLGYKDKSKADKALMTQKEDHYLSVRSFL